jgi:ADP-ribosylglycohydrolase
MTHNRERVICAALIIAALIAVAIGTWQCGKRLGKALEARQERAAIAEGY